MDLKRIAFKYESPAIFTKKKGYHHIFLKKANGVYFWDTEGKKYLDMTSFFGVMNFGHSPDFILNEIKRMKNTLIHGLGDIFSNIYRVLLAEKICKIIGNDYQAIILNTGSEVCEIAIKTAYLYTKKEYVISFENSYHGLTGFSLSLTDRFQKNFFIPFVYKKIKRLSFPEDEAKAEKTLDKVKRLIKRFPVSSIILEPIQARGGINLPPFPFIKELASICKREDIILIFDEIFTGLGRTGKMFAYEWFDVKPDIICIGKGIASGFPLSICAGKKDMMNAWKNKEEETLHASTFAGHPLSSFIAIKFLEKLEKFDLKKEVIEKGDYILNYLKDLKEKYGVLKKIKGKGLLIGIETNLAKEIWKELLFKQRILTLLEGKELNTVALTPPFVITYSQIDEFFNKFEKVLRKKL
ncbi:MAG: aspartate aminotransferase family protein [candidate division WOR-3 bacterium]